MHAAGNNFKCDKIYKLDIPLVNANIVNAIAGTYFFPEVPELTNKKIVGIVGSFVNQLNYFDIYSSVCWFSAYVNLFNMDNQNIFEDFPLPALYNEDSTTTNLAPHKIVPINTKINFRQSYVRFAQSQNFASGLNTLAFSLTFFYNSK